MRDATFTLWGLHALGFDWEADDFMQFVADLKRNDDGGLQIMYGIAGERDLTERTLDELSGYEGSTPVRTGNGAFMQRQNDVFGAVLDSIYLHTKAGGHMPTRLWPVVEDLGEARPGDLGGAGRAQALRVVEADVLGCPRPRREPRCARRRR
jgi:GH15 family glucan-1,4-alpha-glucosidase